MFFYLGIAGNTIKTLVKESKLYGIIKTLEVG